MSKKKIAIKKKYSIKLFFKNPWTIGITCVLIAAILVLIRNYYADKTKIENIKKIGNIAFQLQNQKKYDEAILKWQEAQSELKNYNEPNLYSEILSNEGFCYSNLSQFKDKESNLKKSIIYYNEALSIDMSENNDAYIASEHMNIGVVYKRLSEIKSSKQYLDSVIYHHEKALLYFKKDTSPDFYATCKMNLGTAYLALFENMFDEKYFETSKINLIEALSIFEHNKNTESYVGILLDLGVLYLSIYNYHYNVEDLHTSENYSLQAINILSLENDPILYSDILHNLARTYYKLAGIENVNQNLEKAFKYSYNALEIREKDRFPEKYLKSKFILAKINIDYGLYNRNKDSTFAAINVINELFNMVNKDEQPIIVGQLYFAAALAYIALSNFENQLKNIEKAKNYYEKATEIFTINGYPNAHDEAMFYLSKTKELLKKININNIF